MKDYKITGLNNESITELLQNFIDQGVEFDMLQVPGSLVDNLFIDDFGQDMLIGGHRVKGRKHLLILENFVNCWSSDLTLILTDNDKNYYETKTEYIQDYIDDTYENYSNLGKEKDSDYAYWLDELNEAKENTKEIA